MSASERRACASANRTNQENHAEPAQTAKRTGLRGLSPYTVKNLDDAIAHLEMAIAADSAMKIFGHSYWRQRVQQAGSTPGILPAQTHRIIELMKRLACVS